jgi:transcription termination/antitermination protein NusG
MIDTIDTTIEHNATTDAGHERNEEPVKALDQQQEQQQDAVASSLPSGAAAAVTGSESPAPVATSSPDMKWYVVYASPGEETKVKNKILESVKSVEFKDKFGEVVVPTEEVVELRGGQKRKSERKIFPGYVLVQMIMDEHTWHFIRHINKVRGFVGGTNERPATLSDREVNEILQRVQDGVEKPKPKILFAPGEVVRIIEGPFADFDGVVEAVNYEKNKLKVSVLIFGRSTPVDLDFSQVQKA